MGLDAIYIHVKNNDVLATSFSAMQFIRRGHALHLNETCPLLAAFELCALMPREIRYAAVTYGANSFRIQRIAK